MNCWKAAAGLRSGFCFCLNLLLRRSSDVVCPSAIRARRPPSCCCWYRCLIVARTADHDIGSLGVHRHRWVVFQMGHRAVGGRTLIGMQRVARPKITLAEGIARSPFGIGNPPSNDRYGVVSGTSAFAFAAPASGLTAYDPISDVVLSSAT